MRDAAVVRSKSVECIALNGVSPFKNAFVTATHVLDLAFVGLEGISWVVHRLNIVMLALSYVLSKLRRQVVSVRLWKEPSYCDRLHALEICTGLTSTFRIFVRPSRKEYAFHFPVVKHFGLED